MKLINITGYTATPSKIWKNDIYWSNIKLIKLDNYSDNNYIGYKDMSYNIIDNKIYLDNKNIIEINPLDDYYDNLNITYQIDKNDLHVNLHNLDAIIIIFTIIKTIRKIKCRIII